LTLQIQAEIDGVVGLNRFPNIKERKLFPLLESFLHEVIRHTSFIPSTIPHLTSRDTKIRGYEIPKDTVVFVNQWTANHDRRYWKDPDEFNPRRFLDDKGKLVHKPADKYMIYSTGARKCPGESYVMTLGVHLIATLLSVCTFEELPHSPTSLKLKYALTIRPTPFEVKIQLRKTSLFESINGHSDHSSKQTDKMHSDDTGCLNRVINVKDELRMNCTKSSFDKDSNNNKEVILNDASVR